MRRSMKKAIEEYERRFVRVPENVNRGRGAFYVSDSCQLLEMSRDKYELLTNALEAGFMVGYRLGRKDQKEGRR